MRHSTGESVDEDEGTPSGVGPEDSCAKFSLYLTRSYSSFVLVIKPICRLAVGNHICLGSRACPHSELRQLYAATT